MTTTDRAGGEPVPATERSDGFVRCPFCEAILPPGSVIGTGPEGCAKCGRVRHPGLGGWDSEVCDACGGAGR